MGNNVVAGWYQCRGTNHKRERVFTSENGCRFSEECAYNHQASKDDEEREKLKEKVEVLENVVADSTSKLGKFEHLKNVLRALSRKMIRLEKEIKDMKKKIINQEVMLKCRV